MSERLNAPQQAASQAGVATWSRAEIDAAIAGLDQATKAFSQRVDAMQQRAASRPVPPGPPPSPEPAASAPAPEATAADDGRSARAPEPARVDPRRGGGSLDQRMQEAERDAREYLAQAKRRADSLVSTMVGAVERESAEIRREAELGIRERWRAVEVEASRYLDDARQVADGMVAERQERIHSLSDDVLERGRDLTAGMDDAERIRAQFESFVRALSETASRIAAERPGGGAEVTRLRERGSWDRDGALAA